MSEIQQQAYVVQCKKWSVDSSSGASLVVLQPTQDVTGETVGNDVIKYPCDISIHQKIRSMPVPSEFNLTMTVRQGGSNRAGLFVTNISPVKNTK